MAVSRSIPVGTKLDLEIELGIGVCPYYLWQGDGQ